MTYRSIITSAALSISLIALLAAAPAKANSPAPPNPIVQQATANVDAAESEYRELQSRSEELGGSGSATEAIRNVKNNIDTMEQHIGNLEDLVDKVQGNIAGIGADYQAEDDRWSNSETSAGETAAGFGLKWLLKQIAGKALGLTLTVVEFGAGKAVKELNLDMLEELLESEAVKLAEVRELINALQHERGEEYRKLRELRDIKRRMAALMDTIATERERARINSGRATRHASTARETDAAGDARLRNENGVRLVNPADKPKPQGVRQATQNSRKSSPANAKIAKEIAVTAVSMLIEGGGKTERRGKICSHNRGKEKSMTAGGGKGKSKIKKLAKIGMNLF